MKYSHFFTFNILDEIEKTIQRKSHNLRIYFNYFFYYIEKLIIIDFPFMTFKERSINEIIHQ